MKQLLIILGLLILCACNNKASETLSRELVPNPEKYEHDFYNDSIEFSPDVSIGEFKLLDTINIEKYLGENPTSRLIRLHGELPKFQILSSDKNQTLSLYFHPGSFVNEFAEFGIKKGNQTNMDSKKYIDSKFVTESGIQLGITVGDLKSIKGEPTEIETEKTTIFKYLIDNSNESDFLKKYNYPSYKAEYEFENGYLISFKFGFEYP